MDRGVEFFNDLLVGFVAKYPGIAFRWKLVEAPKSEPEVSTMDKFKEAFHRNFMPDSYSELQNERFLRSNRKQYIKCLEASIWHHDRQLATYFIMLNPIYVVASHFTGLVGIVLLNFVIIAVLSQLQNMITHDDSRIEGEGLLLQVLSAEETIATNEEM